MSRCTWEVLIIEIEDEIDRLTRMINDLLDLSRIEAEMDTSHHSTLDIGSIVAEVWDAFKARADDVDIELHVNVDPDIPKIRGNEEQLWRVLMNLLDNALNFTPPGGRVEVSATTLREGGVVRIEVQDTGSGISPDDLPHLFERFFRTDITRQRSSRSKGSGLGLAMCKSIIENHGGRIGVQSQLGEGSLFWVELPAQ